MTAGRCEMCGHHPRELETKTVQVEVKVKCCSQCMLELDVVELAKKAERKRTFRELSYKWADGLHGQKVIVHSDEDTHPVFCNSQSEYHARGTAYRIQNVEGGWGQVRVDIDPSENCRIRENPRHPNYGIMDNMELGLFLNADGRGGWYSIISWGCRKALDLAEVKRV